METVGASRLVTGLDNSGAIGQLASDKHRPGPHRHEELEDSVLTHDVIIILSLREGKRGIFHNSATIQSAGLATARSRSDNSPPIQPDPTTAIELFKLLNTTKYTHTLSLCLYRSVSREIGQCFDGYFDDCPVACCCS